MAILWILWHSFSSVLHFADDHDTLKSVMCCSRENLVNVTIAY